MPENTEKFLFLFPKAKDNDLTCLVFSKTRRYSVSCRRGVKKPENIHIQETGIREV